MDYKVRLLDEARELAIKLNKLNKFMGSDSFPPLPRKKKSLLYQQQRVMSTYVEILGLRIELEGFTFSHKEE